MVGGWLEEYHQNNMVIYGDGYVWKWGIPPIIAIYIVGIMIINHWV